MRPLLLALAVLAVVLFFAMPASPWEFDEILFFGSLHHFAPLSHQPPPPGYPVFAAVGHVLRLVMPSDFATLVAVSFIGSLAAFVMFAIAFGRMAGDPMAGLAGALLFYFSPALLVHSTLPMSEPGALALLAAAFAFAPRERGEGGRRPDEGPIVFALFLALTVGWRPQFAIFVVPFLLTHVAMMRNWRDRAIALGVFTIICLAWLLPLAHAVGGIEPLFRFEASQASYVSQHDADVSRSGWTPAQLASRFIAHPWGTKILSFPLLIVAAIGAYRMRRERSVIPLAAASIIYLMFALMFMDPADGVRYAIPFILGTAFFAGVGMVWLARTASVPALTFVALFAAGSMIYVSSLISQRSSTQSPPIAAADAAHWMFPANAVALYDLALWPHARYYFFDRQPLRINEGFEQFFDRPDVPMFIYADGISHAPDARVFRWQPSDAYSKLTRNHYRVVSLIPIPPAQRFRVVRGIYAPEREIDGDEWRWLDSPAAMQLPHGPVRTLNLRLGLPVIYPMERNTISIAVGREAPRVLLLERGTPVTIAIRIPEGAPVVRFETARTFIPAEVPGSLNRDTRQLAVKLYDVHTTP